MNRGAGTGLMAFGGVLAVLGAIMRFAIRVQTEGFSINTAGMILLVVGVGLIIVGLLAMLLGSRSTSTVQESVQNTAAGQVRTTERDERAAL